MSVNGYEPLIFSRYSNYAEKIETAKSTPENLILIKPDYQRKLFDLLSIKYIVTSDNLESVSKFNRLLDYPEHNLKVYENRKAAPLFYISNSLVYLPDSNILNKLDDNNYDYMQRVYTSNNFNFKISEKKLEYTVKKAAISDNSAEFIIQSNKQSILVFNYLYYPKWKVSINGKPDDILNINYLFMGVIINAGDNIIKFVYE